MVTAIQLLKTAAYVEQAIGKTGNVSGQGEPYASSITNGALIALELARFLLVK